MKAVLEWVGKSTLVLLIQSLLAYYIGLLHRMEGSHVQNGVV